MRLEKQIHELETAVRGYRFDLQFEMSYQRRRYIESLIISTEAKIGQLKERMLKQ